MKKVLYTSLIWLTFGVTSLYANYTYPNDTVYSNQPLFKDEDPDFLNTTVSKERSNESAVIIAKKELHTFYPFEYLKSGEEHLEHEITVRKRIKLQDRNAVAFFAEFYFAESGLTYGIEQKNQIAILKTNGSVINVDIDKKIKVEDEDNVPDYFENKQYILEPQYYKLAISNLEVGDIIDYQNIYSIKHEMYKVDVMKLSQTTVALAEIYPILSQKIILKFKNLDTRSKSKYYITAIPLNTNENFTSSDKSEDKVFQIHLKNQNRYEYERWNYNLQSLPAIKIMVMFKRKANFKSLDFTGEPYQIKNTISQNEIKKFVSLNCKEFDLAEYDNYDKIVKFINTYKINVTDQEELVKLFYYSYRNVVHYDNDESFARAMIRFCQSKGIPCKVYLALSRKSGNLNTLCYKDELFWLVQPLVGKSVITFRPYNHSTYGYIPYELRGVDAYVVEFNTGGSIISMNKTQIEPGNASDNKLDVDLQFSFTSEMADAKVQRKVAVTGLEKKFFDKWVIIADDYIEYDTKKFIDPKFVYAKKKDKRKVEILKEKDQRKEDETKVRKLKLINQLEEDYEVLKYNAFKLISDGRLDDSSTLAFNDEFIADQLVNKVGEEYLLLIGKMIGSHIGIMEEELKRDNNIHYDFPRTFNYTIKVVLPLNFKISGIEQCNVNEENEMLKFSSICTQNNNVITLNVQKVYKVHYADKNNWDKMVKVLDTAFHFTHLKLLLNK